MAVKISRSGLVEKSHLSVKKDGIVFYQAGPVSRSKKIINFDKIDFIIMSKENNLSFQVGNEVFTIKTNPNNKKHQMVIEELLKAVRQTV